MKRLLIAATSVVALLAVASPAIAQEMVNVNIGSYDVFDKNNDAALLGLEYRGEYLWKGLRPNVGAFATDEGSYYVYGGLGYDFFLTNSHNVVLTPSLAAGFYEDGGGKNLGGHLEFRSGLELAYAFENQHRLGVALHHLSNASIYDRNPGAETLTVQYSIPLTVFGQ